MVGRLSKNSTSTQDVFIQRLYSLNFRMGYFCARRIFIQLQRRKLCYTKRIYLFNFNKEAEAEEELYLTTYHVGAESSFKRELENNYK